jgi:phosphate-selective porin OprO/OprP
MSQTKSFLMLAGAALSLGGVNAALAQQSNPDEVRALVAEMLSDAQTRTSLLAAGGAGHDGQFYLANADGSFRLNVGGQIQFRYIADFRDAAGGNDDFDGGFVTRRTKLQFDGNIVNADWTYKVVGAFDRDGGSFGLEDAWVAYSFGNGWKAQWGQFKLPFLREELVSSRRQLAVDRSVANEIFNQDYSQGVQLSYDDLDWRFAAAFSDGFASRNTDFPTSTAGPATGLGSFTSEADYAFTGRFEFKFQGDWKQAEDFTSEQGAPFFAMVGAAAHYQQDANSGAATDVDNNYLGYTADISLEGDGWNLFGAFMGRHLDGRNSLAARPPSDLSSADDFGWVVQGGFRVAKETELFARYDGVKLDSNTITSGKDTFNFLTVGVNQYYAGHAAKATVDLVYSVDETTNLAAAPVFANGDFNGLGLQGDDDKGEVAVRLQFQLLF